MKYLLITYIITNVLSDLLILYKAATVSLTQTPIWHLILYQCFLITHIYNLVSTQHNGWPFFRVVIV